MKSLQIFRDTEYMDGHFIRTPRNAQTLNYDTLGDAYNQDVSSPQYEYQGTIAKPPQQQQQQHEEQQQQQQQQRVHIEPLTMQRSEVDRDLLLAIQLQDEENDRANQRTRSINPLSNSFWTGNPSDAPTSHSKAQILQHKALAQASQNKTQRRTSVQGGGAGQSNSNSNSNRRAASSAPEEESSSPCLIC